MRREMKITGKETREGGPIGGKDAGRTGVRK